MAEVQLPEEMPFTKLVREAEAQEAARQQEMQAKLDAEHADTPGWVGRPDQAKDQPPPEKLSESPLIQLMVEQEAGVARDHAAGKITDEDYQSFRDMSQGKIEEFQSHLQDAGKDIVEGLREWTGDAKQAFEHLKEEQPDLIKELESGHPKLEAVADTLEALEVIHPLIDTALEGADEIVEVIGDDLPSMARDFVDARANMEGTDPAEIEGAQARLETVTADFDAKIDGAHDSIDAAREKIDADFEAYGEAVDQMHDYAAEHPDAEVRYQIHDAQIDDEIEEDTGVVDA
jgi:archaellum component FlaC